MDLLFCVPIRTKGWHIWIIITAFKKITFWYTDLFLTLGATVYNLQPLVTENITRTVLGNTVISFFLQRLKHGRKALKGPWMVSRSVTTRRSRDRSLSTNIPALKTHNRKEIPSLPAPNAYNEDRFWANSPLFIVPYEADWSFEVFSVYNAWIWYFTFNRRKPCSPSTAKTGKANLI